MVQSCHRVIESNVLPSRWAVAILIGPQSFLIQIDWWLSPFYGLKKEKSSRQSRKFLNMWSRERVIKKNKFSFLSCLCWRENASIYPIINWLRSQTSRSFFSKKKMKQAMAHFSFQKLPPSLFSRLTCQVFDPRMTQKRGSFLPRKTCTINKALSEQISCFLYLFICTNQDRCAHECRGQVVSISHAAAAADMANRKEYKWARGWES